MSNIVRVLLPSVKPYTYTYNNHMKNFISNVEYVEQKNNIMLIKTTTYWTDEYGKRNCKKSLEQYKLKCQNK